MTMTIAPQTLIPTDRTRVTRLPARASYERATIDAILDEGLFCHVGFTVDAQPYVIPTVYARVGDDLYVHGSAASRMLRTLEDGVPVCLTVTPLDDEEDYGLGCWAGEVPLRTIALAPVADPRLASTISPPPSVVGYRRPVARCG